MAIKLQRYFLNSYENPNYALLKQNGFSVLHLNKTIRVLSIFGNGGFGLIKGTTKKLKNNFAGTPVCLFNRLSRNLVREIKSDKNGNYAFKNIPIDQYFIIAFDSAEKYNAVIQDKVIAKDGRT